jgi:hypothetical protein
MVGKWEQIEQQAREEELKELERELHGEQKRGRKPKPKHRRRQQQRKAEPGAPEAGSSRDNGTEHPASDG